MKFKPLFYCMTTLLASAYFASANAVDLDRTYNKEGISVNLFGAVSPTLSSGSTEFDYLYGDVRALDRLSSNGTMRQGTLESLLSYEESRREDERLRLEGMDSAFVGFSVSQRVHKDVRVRTMLGVSATPGYGALVSGEVNFDHSDIGELTVGANGRLPTQSVATSGTYQLLDSAGSYVGVSYDKVPNLVLGGYYVFAEAPSPWNGYGATAIEKGYGATATYQHSFAARNTLSVRGGYSRSERGDELQYNTVAQDRQAFMAGLRYNYYNTTVSLDGGVSKSDFDGNLIDKNRVKAMGLRIGYDFTPRFNVSASYGKQTTRATEALGSTLDFDTLYQNTAFIGQRPIESTQLFKKIDHERYGLSARYDIHRSASINAGISHSNVKYRLTDGDFAKQKNDDYSLGVSFFW